MKILSIFVAFLENMDFTELTLIKYIDSNLDRLGFITENSTIGNTTIILFTFNAQMAMDRILIAELDCKIN